MKKSYDLKNQRAEMLKDAETFLNDKKMDEYSAKMEEVKLLNQEIQAVEDLDAENERFAKEGITNILGVTGGTTDHNEDEYKNAFFYAITNGFTPKNGAGNEKLAPLYNALSEGGGTPTGKDGGFLVPTSFNNMIIEQRRQLVQLANYFSVETVTTPTGWRAVDTAPTTGFVSTDENTAISSTDDQPGFTKVAYSLSKFGLRVPVSNELMNDNTAGLEAYLARWFAKKGVITENTKLLAALDTLTASNLTMTDDKSVIKSLKSAINKSLDPDIALNAVIITNQSGYDYLDGLMDTTGRPFLNPDPTTGTPMMFKSHEVVVMSDTSLKNRTVTTTGATKGDYYPIYIGDMKQFATLFKRDGLEVASTNIGGNAWANDQTEVRGIMRIDVEKMDPSAAIKREIFIAAS